MLSAISPAPLSKGSAGRCSQEFSRIPVIQAMAKTTSSRPRRSGVLVIRFMRFSNRHEIFDFVINRPADDLQQLIYRSVGAVLMVTSWLLPVLGVPFAPGPGTPPR